MCVYIYMLYLRKFLRLLCSTRPSRMVERASVRMCMCVHIPVLLLRELAGTAETVGWPYTSNVVMCVHILDMRTQTNTHTHA